jgi:chorismate synthase
MSLNSQAYYNKSDGRRYYVRYNFDGYGVSGSKNGMPGCVNISMKPKGSFDEAQKALDDEAKKNGWITWEEHLEEIKTCKK